MCLQLGATKQQLQEVEKKETFFLGIQKGRYGVFLDKFEHGFVTLGIQKGR